MTELVTQQTLETKDGRLIGHLTLNKPKALNALNLEMIQGLHQALSQWQDDDRIVAVVLDGEGDKAFCAGGDVVAMHNAMRDNPDKTPEAVEDFFTNEYQVDYQIHTYPKPILLWGNGIVMGGGLGLMSGASHRVVTETSRIAMPEITIGLYPDVGASYFLNKMPAGCGLFLGLTGANINAADALHVRLADHFIAHEHKQSLLEQMQTLEWQNDHDANHRLLTDICGNYATQSEPHLPKSQIDAHQSLIDEVANSGSAKQAAETILAADSEGDKWLSKAQASLKSGSPTTARIVYRQMQEGKDKSLADCFRMELGISCQCGQSGEFQEGVRALLIDKDNRPQWQFTSIEAVTDEVVDAHFVSRWSENNHPLANLGKE
ncbi:Enoyl-CoA hydratase [Saliniradius amylolyticus]|uniref:3-hydroxyisobutyryl-CoA hydrolase n=1 Tax=Saliniradius amylolyticus TaxID=2183582 RepID=A0A2S2E354_9ALTE|nr:enoyl-CoA hydratase/isomerase family protein [Saliniradius amylolyticus]AWL12074.1 Enoyl-CoA hydratase [Saliniradius amylolyticus]